MSCGPHTYAYAHTQYACTHMHTHKHYILGYTKVSWNGMIVVVLGSAFLLIIPEERSMTALMDTASFDVQNVYIYAYVAVAKLYIQGKR